MNVDEDIEHNEKDRDVRRVQADGDIQNPRQDFHEQSAEDERRQKEPSHLSQQIGFRVFAELNFLKAHDEKHVV
jgi:hypothetical protein